MNREETKKAIAVMQHYADGGDVTNELGVVEDPKWNWIGNPASYGIAPRSWQVGDTGKMSTGSRYTIEAVLNEDPRYKYVARVGIKNAPMIFNAAGEYGAAPELKLLPPDQPKVENSTDREKDEVLGILHQELRSTGGVASFKTLERFGRIMRVIRYIENH